MVARTDNFGLVALQPGDSLAAGGYEFINGNIYKIDRLLAAATSHDHTDTGLGLADPTVAPTLTLSTASGNLPAGTTIRYRYTYVDQYGSETAASPEAFVVTAAVVQEPGAPGLLSSVTVGGSLLGGRYNYAVSAYVTSNTNETKLGGRQTFSVPFTTATNVLNLTMPSLPTGATGFNIYRRAPGEATFVYLASTTSGTADFTASTDTWASTAHGLVVGDTIEFTASDTNPTEYATGVDYYVVAVPDADSFRLSATPNGSVLDGTVDSGASWTYYKSSYSDDGGTTPNYSRRPQNKNLTNSTNNVLVELPGAVPANATWKIYRTFVTGNWTNSNLTQVTQETFLGSGIIVDSYTDSGLGTGLESAPEVTEISQVPSKISNNEVDFSYTPYTPTITGWSAGDATVTAEYAELGKLVFVKFDLVYGSTTTATAPISISLPVNASGVGWAGMNGIVEDASPAAVAPVFVEIDAVGTFTLRPMSTVTALAGGIEDTNPWTWATSDTISAHFVYEAA